MIRTVSATLPQVCAARGYYLLISSAAAFTALPGMAAYCAAKAGVEHFGTALRLELAPAGVAVGTAHPSWVDTDLVRDVKRELPSFGAALARLPWPMNVTVPVSRCAEVLVRAVERRSRRVYVPRPVAAVQAIRTLVNSRVYDAAVRRAGGDQIATLEDDVRAIGRSFGEHSMGLTSVDERAMPINFDRRRPGAAAGRVYVSAARSRPSVEERHHSVHIGQFGHRSGGAERRVPERPLPLLPGPDVGVRHAKKPVAGRDSVVDLADADAQIEVLRPQHRGLVGCEGTQRCVAKFERSG